MFSRKVAEGIGGDCLNLRHRTAERKGCEQTDRQDRRQIGRIGRMIYKALTKSTTMENYAYPVRQFAGTTKRVVQTLDLKDDPELVAEYQHWHSREGIWPEILQGIKDSGVLEMEIYLLGTRLFMIVELAADDSWDEVMARMGAGPRQAEWEAFVSRFQRADPAAGSTEKWQRMERIFHVYE